jgi:hypothetical protein
MVLHDYSEEISNAIYFISHITMILIKILKLPITYVTLDVVSKYFISFIKKGISRNACNNLKHNADTYLHCLYYVLFQILFH